MCTSEPQSLNFFKSIYANKYGEMRSRDANSNDLDYTLELEAVEKVKESVANLEIECFNNE